jgi:hypothetical protein
LLLGVLAALLLLIGEAVGGQDGLIVALPLAVLLNGGGYFFSDRLTLAMGGAHEVGYADAPELHDLVAEVARLVNGILQSLSLARWRRAFWWIPANAIAWFVAGLAGLLVQALLLPATTALGWIVDSDVVGLVGALVLLVPLSELKARPNPTRQPA